MNENILQVEYKDYLPDEHWQGDLRKKILKGFCTTSSCMMVKRQALVDVGMFDENLKVWQDYELTIRLAQRSPFYYVNEPLCVYRVDQKDPHRLTNKYHAWLDAVNYIHRKHAALYNALNFFERLEVRKLVWYDAISRCEAAGMQWHKRCYQVLVFALRAILKIKNVIKKDNT